MKVEKRPEPPQGKPALPWPSREECVAAPKCTTEGVGYSLDCWPCRLRDRKLQYLGESRKSSYQSEGAYGQGGGREEVPSQSNPK